MTRISNSFSVLMGQKSQSFVEDYYPLSAQTLIENAMHGSIAVNATSAMSYYRTSSAVSTAVDMVASKIEQVMPVIDVGTDKLVDSHPVLDFLRKPNDFQMWRRFIGQFARHYMLTGNAYALGAGTNTLPPQGLFAVIPSNASPFEIFGDGFAQSYDVHEGIGRGKFTRTRGRGDFGVRFYDGPVKEIYHVRDFTTRTQNLLGDSKLESILLEISQNIAGARHNTNLLKNGGRLSLALLFKQNMPFEELMKRAKAARKELGGEKNAGKIVTIGAQDADLKEFGVNPKDMDYVKLHALSLSAVFTRYNIPLPLVVQDRQTFNNYETAVLALYDDAVLPIIEVLFEALTDMLMPRFGRDPARERLAIDEYAITALKGRLIEELDKRAKLGLETLNELRGGLPGRDDIEGGNAVFASASSTPIAGEDMPEEEPIDPDLDPNAPNNQADGNDEDA